MSFRDQVGTSRSRADRSLAHADNVQELGAIVAAVNDLPDRGAGLYIGDSSLEQVARHTYGGLVDATDDRPA